MISRREDFIALDSERRKEILTTVFLTTEWRSTWIYLDRNATYRNYLGMIQKTDKIKTILQN